MTAIFERVEPLPAVAITEEALGSWRVLHVAGPLALETRASFMLQAVAELETMGNKIAFELDGLTDLDGVGLGALIHAVQLVARSGGDFMLIYNSDLVSSRMRLTGLDQVFDGVIAPTTEACMLDTA